MIFMMWVVEYDKNCPSPNNGIAYISYLDSVPHSSISRCATSSENRIASLPALCADGLLFKERGE